MRSVTRDVVLALAGVVVTAWFMRSRTIEVPVTKAEDHGHELTESLSGQNRSIATKSESSSVDAQNMEATVTVLENTESPVGLASTGSGIEVQNDNYSEGNLGIRNIDVLQTSSTSEKVVSGKKAESDWIEELDLGQITCDFGSGATTFLWHGKIKLGGMEWQGGPITYDSIDLVQKTARMVGSQGSTGSIDGMAKASIISANTRLDLLSDLPNGQKVFTTIFSDLDDTGRHIAFMSRHVGPRGAITTYADLAQGSCG